MPLLRRVPAAFVDARLVQGAPGPGGEPGLHGLDVAFDPGARHADLGRIEDFIDLGPELTLASAAGVAKLMRLLKSLRLASGPEPAHWLGRAAEAEARLAPRGGAAVVLMGRTRTRLRFTAWTEEGVETIEPVAEVVTTDDAFLVRRLGHGLPVRVPRASVTRQETTRDSWFEVHGIERP